jgi:hypothetical protein
MRYVHFSIVLLGACPLSAQLPNTGDFDAAYSVTASGHARSATPSPTSVSGSAIFGISLCPKFLVAGSTQTFTSTNTPGSGRTTGYGVTKFEFNRDVVHKETASGLNRDFSLDYTITLPTNGPPAAGTEGNAHQFLAMLSFDHSVQQSFEIDAGDYMGGRDSKPGYKHTALLSLIGQRNLRSDGKSNGNLDFELDASPSSEGTPASVLLSTGVTYGFKSGLQITALAIAGITAIDPEIGVAISIKFKGNLAGKGPNIAKILTFSRQQRLERVRNFGRLGRF